MLIVNPDPFLLPTYRISPFRTGDIACNAQLRDDDFTSTYFDNRFGKKNWQYTYNGREAIRLALEYYNLQSNDLVTILTTSENFYISSCVTQTIEGFCQWNREVTPETKIIFVNHEFGYPYPEMEKIKSLGLPIIEDCCTTFFSQNTSGTLGKEGDFSVYSFPKFFPIQIGGILVSNKSSISQYSTLKSDQIEAIQNTVSYYLRKESELLQKRQSILEYAIAEFSKFGFESRFENSKLIVPSALVLKNLGIIKDLNAFKVFLNHNGIQNSIFYGEDAFFLPIHQGLTTIDIDYFSACIQAFLKS